MATTIITKHTDGSGAPTPDKVSVGELAIDLVGQQLYTKDNNGDVIKLGSGKGAGNIADATEQGVIATWDNTSQQWTPEGAVVVSGGNVGIGTDSPSNRMTIDSPTMTALSIGSDQYNNAHISSGDTSDQSTGINIQVGYPASLNYSKGAVISLYGNTQGSSYAGGIVYQTSSHVGANNNHVFIIGDSDEAMRIDASGRVGIGGTPSRSTKEIEEEAESTLANWKSQLDERMKAEPKADKKAVTQEITGHDKMPTKAELVEKLTERDIGGGNALLQVAGDGYFSGTVNTNMLGLAAFSVTSVSSGGAAFVPSGTSTTGTVSIGNTSYRWLDGWFSGRLVASNVTFRDSVGVTAKDLIETLHTLREATKDETTLEGLRDAIGNAVGGLVEKFEAMQDQAVTQDIQE